MREGEAGGAGTTFLPDVPARTSSSRATYSFSVDGDLVGKGLDWHGWGEPKATAFGTLVERPASGLVDTFSGSVTASAPRRCKGATYYTRSSPTCPRRPTSSRPNRRSSTRPAAS